MGHAENVFLQEFKTVHKTAPFDKIAKSYYEEAVDNGIKEQNQEINAIIMQRSMPTFENTIVALERSGKTLSRVLNVFYPLLSADSDDELMEISMRISPKLSEHGTNISLNEKLWERIKSVYENKDKLSLDTEDTMLLQKTYDSFARSGANLKGEDREKYRKLDAELSDLTLKFGQNVLKEVNTYEFWLNKEDLAGLPESAIDAAKFAAKEKGKDDAYLITLSGPSYMSFMKYSSRADLREKLYKMYNSRNTKGEYNNLGIMTRITELRMELGKLLGGKNYASFSLQRSMAENPENVYTLLNQLKASYTPALKKELKELTAFASKLEGKKVSLNAWDYSYYSNKLKDAKYSINDEELRPYFELNNTVNGVFGLATKLYGLNFTENPNIVVYHPEVKAYDVTDADGSFIGVIYTDFFPRESKRGGAWMTGFRDELINENGENIRPHVSITMNFTRPTETKPSLLTYNEVETFLHEFGHSLHGLLAKTKYSSMSGTSVYRDFVELPSQFNENFLNEKEFLDGFARHYQTGKPMPQELVNKIVASSQYGAAYSCIRQLNFGLIDMAWHTITTPVTDVAAFENEAIKDVQIFPIIDGCLISPQFTHIFAGGYAAGYYSYKWAEVLDADAFAKFKENGIFDKATAKSFRDNILSKGGTEHPMTLYKRFRGQEPSIKALLDRDGITPPKAKKGKTKVEKMSTDR
ncbi:MAG: M3 family metallopeptidase [Muribaculaceae bacterium]